MSDVVTINGKEYKIGDIVKSEAYYKDEFNDLVLNGFTVKVGDTWLTRDKKKVVIQNIASGTSWPIISEENSTFSALGIYDAKFIISNDDLETKFVEDECAEPIDGEPTQEELIPMAKKAKPVKKKKDSEDIEELPDLDIEIGDVWLTAASNKVEIIEYAKTGFGNESPFVWKANNGDLYTATGKYFSLLTASSKDLVTRVSRATKIETEDCDNTEFTEDTSAVPSECTDMGLLAESNVKESDTISYDIIDTANCECNFDYEFENTLKRLVAILSDKIKERALNRDLAAVKDLTKKLEKVIALESL